MKKKRNFIIFAMFIIMMLFPAINIENVLAHGGDEDTEDNHYQVSYTKEDISMQKLGLEITKGGAIEFNVSVTEENTSMTIIIEVERNNGPLWGLYFENQTTYYSAKNGTTDPVKFSSTGLNTCCIKILDHVSYYAVTHINRTINDSYLIALINTHTHEVDDTKFNLIILKGFIGEETFILNPPAVDDPALSFIILTLVLGVGSVAIGLVTYTLLIMPRRRK